MPSPEAEAYMRELLEVMARALRNHRPEREHPAYEAWRSVVDQVADSEEVVAGVHVDRTWWHGLCGVLD